MKVKFRLVNLWRHIVPTCSHSKFIVLWHQMKSVRWWNSASLQIQLSSLGRCGVWVINTAVCHHWPLDTSNQPLPPPLCWGEALPTDDSPDRKCLIGLHWTNTGSYLMAGYGLHLFLTSAPPGTPSTLLQALCSPSRSPPLSLVFSLNTQDYLLALTMALKQQRKHTQQIVQLLQLASNAPSGLP